MFRNKTAKETVSTIIAADTVISGSIIASHGVRVDGVVQGAVISREQVIVGMDAVVSGGVRGSSVYNAGDVYGNIEAPTGKIEISDTGRVFGDITAKRVVIDELAVLQGKCTMTSAEAASTVEATSVPADLEETVSQEAQALREQRTAARAQEPQKTPETAAADTEAAATATEPTPELPEAVSA